MLLNLQATASILSVVRETTFCLDSYWSAAPVPFRGQLRTDFQLVTLR